MGTAPRGTEAAEAAVFFACSEAIQNATKYAGHAAQITLRLRHQQGTLAGSHRGYGRDLHPRLQPRTRHCPDHLDALAGGRWVAMSEVILLSPTASLNPTLLAATTPDAPASEPVKTGAGLSVWRVHDQQHALGRVITCTRPPVPRAPHALEGHRGVSDGGRRAVVPGRERSTVGAGELEDLGRALRRLL